MLNQNTHTYI